MTQQTLKTINIDVQFLTEIYHALGAAYDYTNLHDLNEGFRKMDRNKQASPLAAYFDGFRHTLGDILLGEGVEDEPSE